MKHAVVHIITIIAATAEKAMRTVIVSLFFFLIAAAAADTLGRPCSEDDCCDDRRLSVWEGVPDHPTKRMARGQEFACEFGKYVVCHRFLPPAEARQDPIEMCVQGEYLMRHLRRHPGDTRGPCPYKPPRPDPCPPTCAERPCPMACQNLTAAAATDGIDCTDCQGAQGKNGTAGAEGNDGVRCWDLNGNGVCDDGGNCTPEDCRGPASNCTCADPVGGNCTCPETVKLCCYIAISGTLPPTVASPNPVLGQIRWFAFKDCLQDVPLHATCQGQLLAISLNAVLFTLLQTRYGGDGVITFRLPNFSGMKTWRYVL